MEIKETVRQYAVSADAQAFMKIMKDGSIGTVFLDGCTASAPAMLLAASAPGLALPMLIIMQDADEAGYFYSDLMAMQVLGAYVFPSSYRRKVKYGQRDAASEILRTEVLSRLTAWNEGSREEIPLVVTCPEALAELVVSKKLLCERSLMLSVGETHDITELSARLRELGFVMVDYVYEPGQFAVRGSIVDVFSFSSEYPFRLDFFGDEVDSIRTFEVDTQLSRERRERVEIVPELITVGEEKEPMLSFVPKDTVIVAHDFDFVRDIIQRTYDEGFAAQGLEERLETATEQERPAIMEQFRAESMLISGNRFAEDVEPFRKIVVSPGQSAKAGTSAQAGKTAAIHLDTTPQPLFHKNFELLTKTLTDYRLQGYEICILADSAKQQQRLRDIFAETGGPEFTDVDRTLHGGFVDNHLKVCFLTDHQIFDRFHKYELKSDKARSGKMALTMKEIQEMQPGDFIVHVDLGIGKFAGLVRVPTQNGYQEVIRILYKNNDKVDISIHSLYKISRYKRGDSDTPPTLSTLGTGAWDRLKERTKKRIKDIARDLIKLYAARRKEQGFAFSADSYLQHELEASFMYEDTPDQLKATQDIKADMESRRPMDRLVCGDVGFGKTEVAVRAAFKAACDSKQVAVLVPTTVLAYQHWQTFSKRLKDLPVRVEYLSRARSAKQTKEILADLEAGRIDILIGTHKLIGKSVKWKDLGLLIIDEEQKFGVSTKEKLRKLKVNVDTLTMSATPIPRTLQFSLMGARDMSVMQTPPPNRYPVSTEVHCFDKDVIVDAINFEMSRGGQVFFVNDRISSLPSLKALIEKYIPDARVAVGHGQMPPEKLEKVVMGFMAFDYDVLLSTTIVENGIDISNANTIIINDAHRFGLSDLHQMRGRVGRSNKKAFCYLLAPPKAVLTQEARRRLEALETFSDLGSGFNLSMQDLDIRGAGNLLGAEQSGFMEDLGYETYQKILSQAVTELRNDEFGDMFREQMQREGEKLKGDEFVDDCTVESDLEMFLPELYVPSSSERMLLYRELENIKNDRDLEAYRQRLRDRFGEIPPEGEELLYIVTLRRLGKRLGFEKVILKQGRMSIQFVSNAKSAYYQSEAFGNVLAYMTANVRRCDLREHRGRRLMHVSNVNNADAACQVLRSILSATSTVATEASTV